MKRPQFMTCRALLWLLWMNTNGWLRHSEIMQISEDRHLSKDTGTEENCVYEKNPTNGTCL